MLIIPGGIANPITETTTVATVPRRFTLDTQTEAWGYLCGCVLALGASLSFAAARAGIISGLTPGDLILMRFSVAGVVLMPPLLRWGLPTLAGIGWRRGLILTVLGGPAFALMQMGGYAFAPLAHGAVIHPASVTILSTGIAAALLGERLSRVHLIGAGLVMGGIVLISWQGLQVAAGVRSWVGDMLFFTSAVLWAVFTVLIRHWRLPAVRAISVVSFLSLLVILPGYLGWRSHGTFWLVGQRRAPAQVFQLRADIRSTQPSRFMGSPSSAPRRRGRFDAMPAQNPAMC